ncbi:hypothetical protein NBRC10512_001933 [Rhodotorula toruloides]|uniref:RHTO0S03e12046g1_1 n=2 Tax=Rhodotorula toruloides TaxID=5286 RepID=A0A061AM55_RHOTO|nr:uncharacterized protein RHTO_00567 [Rhodotorula toruloides NP11]EMS26139.1 hypothetical protein RHTO_00567 [Rhodotorula toruloides NP11]CDR38678.1 RHTO0S03e12046g1_1 [Rhodotorula toruloides]
MPQTSSAHYALAGRPPLLPAAHQLDNSAFDGWEPFGMWLDTVYIQARNTLGYMIRTRQAQEVKDACERRQDAIVQWRRSFPDPSTLHYCHQVGELLPLVACMGNLAGIAEVIWTTPLEHALVLPTWQVVMCKNVTGPVPTHPSAPQHGPPHHLASAHDPFAPGRRSVSQRWWEYQAHVFDRQGSHSSIGFDKLPEHLKNFNEPFQPRHPAPEASSDPFPPSRHPFTHPTSHQPHSSQYLAVYPEDSHLYANQGYDPTEAMYPILGSNATLDEHGNLVPLSRRTTHSR